MKIKILCLILIILSLIFLLLVKKVIAPNTALAQNNSVIATSSLMSILKKPILVDLISVNPIPTQSLRIASSTFDRIAFCESTGSSTAKNPNSTASGLYQFLDSSWKYYGQQLWGDQWVLHSKLNAHDSMVLAAYVYGKNGAWPDWEESSGCWFIPQ